jgi:hypothetical protein
VIPARTGHDGVTATEPILANHVRRHVCVTGIREVAIRRATNESTIARRVEPTLCLAVGDDRCRWLLRLVVALTATTAVAPVPTAIAVELLTLALSASVIAAVSALIATLGSLATIAAVIAIVAVMMTWLAMFSRALVMLAEFTRRAWFLFPRLGRRVGGWWRRGWCDWRVLSNDGSGGTWRRFGDITTVLRCFGAPVEVRVRLACVISGRTAVRARPAAATLRASTFGHATVFVMGCVLTTAHRLAPMLPRGAPVVDRSHVTAREPVRATNDARGVRCGRLP